MSTKLSFTTMNLYNLNLPGLRMYGRDGYTQDAYDRKIAWTRRALQLARADVIGFQELWHADALAEAFDGAFGSDYALLAPRDANGGRIVCAAAVRKELLDGEPEWIRSFPPAFKLHSSTRDQDPEIAVALDAFSRPVLRLAIKPVAEAPAIQVFISHLKSKSPTRIFGERWFKENQELYKPHDDAIGAGLSTVRRTAEATALRIILNEHMVGKPTPTVVLGDLNDGHLSNTLAILTGQPKYLTPLARGGRDTALYSGQALQEYRSQRDVYYTYIYQGVHESLDHILVSEEFYDMSRMRLWAFEGMDVYNDHLNQPEHKEAEGAIDHGVVRAHFVYKPTPEARAKMRG